MTDTAISTYDPESKNQRGDFLEFLRRTQDMDPERLSDRDLTSSLFVNLYDPLSTPSPKIHSNPPQNSRQRHNRYGPPRDILLPRQEP
jgi:hypothetical protein